MSGNPYSAAAQRVAADLSQQRAGALLVARETTPEQSTEAIRLSRASGISVPVVRTDPNTVRQDVERRQVEAFAALSPMAAKWVAKPENLAVARDDVSALSRVVSTILNPAPEIARFLVDGDPQRSVDKARALAAAVPRTVGSTIGGAGELYRVAERNVIHRPIDAVLGTNYAAIAPSLGDPFIASGDAYKVAADAIDVPQERQSLGSDIAGAVGQMGTQVVQALTAPLTLFPSLLSQGADQMAERVARADAERTGAGDLAIVTGAASTGVLERFGIDRLLRRVPPRVRDPILRRIADVGMAGGIEAVQETVEGLSQDLLTRALLDDDYAIGEGLAREATAAGGAAGILRIALSGFNRRRTHVQAQAERQHLDTLVEAAQASKTRERLPEALEELVEDATEGQSVYVPMEALESYYGARTAAAVSTLTGSPAVYAEARETGVKVAIPLSRYLSIVTPEAHAALAPTARLRPGEDVPEGEYPTREQIEQEIATGLQQLRAGEPEPFLGTAPDATGPLITDPALMGADSYADYQAKIAAAELERETERRREREAAQMEALNKLDARRRKAMEAEVASELAQHPIYKARAAMTGNKRPDGTPAIKLDRAALGEQFGDDVVESLTGLTRVRGGLSPDEAAVILGYPSGAKLVHDLTTAPALADMARVEAEARLKAVAPVDVDSAADASFEAQAAVMLKEIQALENRNGGVRTRGEVLREVARRLIAEKKVTDVQPHLYRQAEAKAGRDAYRAAAKQDWRAAAAARRRQLQNLYLYREARNAREEARNAGRYLAQFGKRATRAKIGKAGGGYLEQIDAMLDRFDFQNLTRPQMRDRQSLSAWLRAKAEQGVVVDLPPTIADEAFRLPFKRLKVGELRELRDAVRHLAHLANEANVIRVGGESYDRMMVDEAMAVAVRDGSKARPPRAGVPTVGEQIRGGLLQGRALTATATDLARELDGYRDGGAVWRHTVQVIRKANDRTTRELQTAQERLAQIKLQYYSKAELRAMDRAKFHDPATGDDWSKGRILALALNWGNAGNREAILTQAVARLSPEQVGGLLRRLDARDWAYVQDVWTLIDGYWPAIAEAQKRRTGLVPEKVEHAPFSITTADGKTLQIEGGYYPLKYAPDSVKTMREEEDGFFERVRTGKFAKASTKRGHTEERVGSGGRTVRLDSGVTSQHLRDVVRDLYLGDAVNFAYQALHGQQFADAARDTGQVELVRGLDVWLKDVAAGEIGLRRFDERALRSLRANFTASVLTWKVSSAALQVTGVLQSAVVLGKGPMLEGIKQYAAHPVATYRHAIESSDFMRTRVQTHVEAVQQVLDAEAGALSAARATMIRHGYWMISRVQAMVDVATWTAAEREGLRKFKGDAKRARAWADDVVSRSQGSGDFIDKNAIQRGTLGDGVRQSEYIRATTALQGYMITKWNAAYGRTREADLKSLRGALSWSSDMVSLFVWEGLAAAVIRGQWPDDEDDDGSTVDDWLAKAGEEGASALLGGLPGLSMMASELRGYDAKSIVADFLGIVADTIEQADQGEMDRAWMRANVKLAGYAAGVPASQINKTLDALEAANRGEEVGALEYISGPTD